MNTPLLFNCPKGAPSTRQRLTAFKKEHGIRTYRTPDMLREDEPWLALVPFADDVNKSVGEIMADSCRLYEESGGCATGEGELSAVRKLCGQLDIRCDL